MRFNNAIQNRMRGAMFGLLCGDAVGTTLEFTQRDTYAHIDDMIGGGPFGLAAGEYTDDGAMALCLASSLLFADGFEPESQMDNYVKWMQNGFMSSNGTCFDIGGTVSEALHKYLSTGNPYAGSTSEFSAGNGSIMRLAPIPIFYYGTPANILKYAQLSSATTHGHEDCISACAVLSWMIASAIMGNNKEYIINTLPDIVISDNILNIINNKTYLNDRSCISGTGYVVDSLNAAIWAFNEGKTFKECILLAANLGQDADTTAAITGQLAGAYYGFKNIPDNWKQLLANFDIIYKITDGLISH